MSRKNTSQRDSGHSGFEVPEDGYRDLFGELIPPDECVSNEEAKNKSNKKTPKKRKQPYDDFFDTPIRPKRVFIHTPRFQLYQLSLNVSGVQHIQDSPQISINNESKRNNGNNDNDKKSQQVFEGVVVFVDYKIEYDRKSTTISQKLISMGAKVEKTFNRKVTHVMFCDGYRSTYNKAVERNIPLVSARWMEYSYKANKMLDPATYPPVGIEKYTKTPPRKINIPVHKSYSIGRWLSHQQYLISDLSEPVKDFQIRRHKIFGSALKFNIFDDAGIYISDSCESPAKLLRRLVQACGGHCTSTESIANVVVGYTLQMNNNIHEKWILDCITQGILLNKCQYNLVNFNEK
ncbi:unnamed protein product [Macrosiphum euphorbiae]|uniref:BRCT domain-containing protein n=1 Tax=Macrosiphum euphorbiae TaxID=13131 RepID=A0AAV0WE60_9HEMI|nr:unnamed protein product [Macrosiphum euphorbiae]